MEALAFYLLHFGLKSIKLMVPLLQDINDLPSHISSEIMHFFEVYKQLEEKQTVVEEVLGREEAEKIIEKAIKNYKEKFEN